MQIHVTAVLKYRLIHSFRLKGKYSEHPGDVEIAVNLHFSYLNVANLIDGAVVQLAQIMYAVQNESPCIKPSMFARNATGGHTVELTNIWRSIPYVTMSFCALLNNPIN